MKKNLTREELYEMVWKTPIQQLAKQFSLSDVWLAKVCRKNHIPLPGRGYWRKIETGKKVSQKPLPKLKTNQNNNIDITCREKKEKPIDIYSDALNEIIKKESDILNKITVNFDSIPTHKYALRAEKLLLKTKVNDNGIIYSRSKYPPPIYVSKKSLSRAIQIIDTLLIALESRNFRIRWPKENKRYFSTTTKKIEVGFSIFEKLDRKDHKPTKEEIAKEKQFSWCTPPKWDYEPSGNLTLTLLTPKNLCNIKHNWNDGKIRRIENQLNDLIIEVHKVAEEYKRTEEREKQWEIEAAKQQMQYLEKHKKLNEYKRKMDFIFSAIDYWKQSKMLNDFCKAISDSCENKILTEDQKNISKEIIILLEEYINRTNPIYALENFLKDFETKYKWLSYY